MRVLLHPLAGCALIAALCCAIYWPGLGGGFLFDDYHVIVSNAALELPDVSAASLLDAALSSNTGPLKRPLALLSFALDRSVAGLDPRPWKLHNLILHALNAALLLLLLRRVLAGAVVFEPGRASLLALLAALAWALHPINVAAVLYVVQRMTLLASGFMLAGMLAYVVARTAQIEARPVPAGVWPALCACALLGPLCKETALLLPLYLGVIELFVFRARAWPAFAQVPQRVWWLLAGLLGVTLALVWPTVSADYAARAFGPGERLLTEARVLLRYLFMLVLPDPGQFAVFHDDVVLSRSLFSPWTTLPAVLVLGCAAIVVLRRRPRGLAFALAWFLAGHALESGVVPLEIMHEHRNYLAGCGIITGLIVALDALARRHLPAPLRLAPVLFVMLAWSVVSALRTHAWSDPYTQMALEVHHHPASARSQYAYGRLSVERGQATGDPTLAAAGLAALERAAQLRPNPRPYLAYGALLKVAVNDADAARTRHWIEAVLAESSDRIRVEVLQQLIECQAYGECRHDPGPVNELAGRMLSDPTLDRYWARRALEWLAIYYLRVLGDAGGGINILRDLATEQPRDGPRVLRLAEALADTGAADAARALAERVAAQQPWHLPYSDRPWWRRIERLRARLDHDVR